MRVRLPTLATVLCSVLFVFCVPACAEDVVAVPAVSQVTDLTGTLSPAARAALKDKLMALETAKGSQVAVLVLPSTAPEDIATFAHRVFTTWKLGRHGVDDGVLLIVAKSDRKIRIEVGRGLEGPIPDAYAKRITADTIAPRLKAGDYEGGLNAGVDALSRLIRAEPLPGVTASAPDTSLVAVFVVFGGLIVVLFIGGLLSMESRAYRRQNEARDAELARYQDLAAQRSGPAFSPVPDALVAAAAAASRPRPTTPRRDEDSRRSSSSSVSEDSYRSSSSSSSGSDSWSGGGGDSAGGGADSSY